MAGLSGTARGNCQQPNQEEESGETGGPSWEMTRMCIEGSEWWWWWWWRGAGSTGGKVVSGAPSYAGSLAILGWPFLV